MSEDQVMVGRIFCNLFDSDAGDFFSKKSVDDGSVDDSVTKLLKLI